VVIIRGSMGKLMRKGKASSGPVRSRDLSSDMSPRTPNKQSKKEFSVGKGRKVKYTYAEVHQALTDCSGMVTYAAKRLGTTWDTLTKYIKQEPKLESHIISLQERRLDKAEMVLDEWVEKGDKTMTIFFLKTKGRKRGYVEDDRVDLSKLAQPITFIYQPPPPQSEETK
jgi:hypothetical protein